MLASVQSKKFVRLSVCHSLSVSSDIQ